MPAIAEHANHALAIVSCQMSAHRTTLGQLLSFCFAVKNGKFLALKNPANFLLQNTDELNSALQIFGEEINYVGTTIFLASKASSASSTFPSACSSAKSASCKGNPASTILSTADGEEAVGCTRGICSPAHPSG